ncbi:MAG: ParA family protein [Phenylobacterium sp.]|uniref:ParA family protein n=1 Tax=Phenylobacterium sp. TaxID=1871053 RepID=UPI00273716B2|nr:ParA family protein [Phenylobacterium sp.]MDP3173229.1 ParA family protein [Phenylobacterium sp.]
MKIVAFVSPKGGAGKTTSALLLALGLHDLGLRVAMIDADPNKPLVHWASLPKRPERITVHAAPTEADIPDALREAKAKSPDWMIVDTEGSLRAGIAFAATAPDMVITPLAASAIEAHQALKAAELVDAASRRLRRKVLHACLLTRLPAAVRPRSLRQVVAQLREGGVAILPTALIEKEVFRLLFAYGGGLTDLEQTGAPGVTAARLNAQAYVAAVIDMVEGRPADPPAPGTSWNPAERRPEVAAPQPHSPLRS